MKTLSLAAVTATCAFALAGRLPAQMADMPMDYANMPGMHHEHSQQSGPKPKQPDAPQPTMPFGRVADGSSPQSSTGPLPLTQTPLRLGSDVQEQEHPDHRTGAPETNLPDLLADARTRPAQPLTFFTAKAFSQNPTLREAEAQVRRLRAEAKQQGLWANPEVGYEADHIRGGVYHSGEQGGYIQQVVPIGGQRSSAKAAVEQRAKQAEAALEQQRMRVTSAVEQAFYAALAMQSEVALRSDLMRIAIDAAQTAHQLANVGQADAPDILQSEVEREQAKLDHATAQREFRKAFSRLAAVSGEATLLVSPLQGDLANVPDLGMNATLSAADASPTLHLAQQAVGANEAAVRSARRQMLPELTIHAGLQQDNEPLEIAQRRVGIVGVAQAGITLPLWNRNQGAIEAANASVSGSQAAIARTRLQLRSEAEQAMQDYANAAMQARQYREELLPRAQRAYQLYQQKYSTMAAAYPQVLVSQRTLFQLQIEYVHALASAWQNAVLLQHGLLSGGLESPEQIVANP